MHLARARRWIAPLCALAAKLAEASEGREYRFKVFLEERPIGSHRFAVANAAGGAYRVESEARFEVKFLGITAYRYRHRAVEDWAQGCLARIEATTSDNGRELAVRGMQRDGRFRLEAPPRSAEREGCVASYAYWDLPLLRAQRELLNPQTGEYDAVAVEPMGTALLQLNGAAVPAQRYRIRGAKLAIDLWYSPDGQWLALESTAGGNRRLRYLRE